MNDILAEVTDEITDVVIWNVYLSNYTLLQINDYVNCILW